jgi:hypothetical protein
MLLLLALVAGALAESIECGPARFTVVSPSLIRLEMGNNNSVWDERPTLSYPNGWAARTGVDYAVTRPTPGSIAITTDELALEYAEHPEGFTAASLCITVTATGTKWRPGDMNDGNLRGSRLDLGCYSTFDSCYSNGLSPGPLSTNGWALMDDTGGVRMETENNKEVGFPWFSSKYPCDPKTGVCGPTTADWYFFGHGHRYRDALADFALVSGKVALPPRSAFGVWWSTWYKFSAEEMTETVLRGFADHGLPLDVVVLDADWHTRPSQFSWNKDLFPDPLGYQSFLHSRTNPLGHPLVTSLNLHPQGGVSPCEANFSAFARAIGVDPASQVKVRCQMTNATWTKALFDTLLDPKGIDNWWADSEGCGDPTPAKFPLPGNTGCPTAQPYTKFGSSLLWQNMVYDSMISKTGRRPLVLSRYGGIGNQRYGIGFSGDTESAWPTLKYQVEMTSTAANVLQAYWSHDIGGYNVYCPANPGVITPCGCEKVVSNCNLTLGTCKRAEGELYTRWLQFGAVSPIMRTHCAHCDRRIWMYPDQQFAAMKAAYIFRNALVPYLYTAGRSAYDHAVAAVHPLYYDFDVPEAYTFAPSQYMLGDAMVAAPIAATQTNYSAPTHTNCTVELLGCYDDHPPKLEPHEHGGNDPQLTVAKCVAMCSKTDTYMAIDSSGPGAGGWASQCSCGTAPPPGVRRLNDSVCNAGCSGNRSEACGGVWAASVYQIDCGGRGPVAPRSPRKDIWLPPGQWLPWNTSWIAPSSTPSSSSHGNILHDLQTQMITGPTVLKGVQFALHEIPLFVRAGAVVPTQTMRKELAPLVWVIFPGENGSGSHYEDDGTSTEYQQANATATGAYSYWWTTLNHTTGVGKSRVITIASAGPRSSRSKSLMHTGPLRQHVLQMRRLVDDQVFPATVECNGKTLPKITPPSFTESANVAAATSAANANVTVGWWVAQVSEDSLWVAGGSLMIALPVSPAISVAVSYSHSSRPAN